MAFPFKTGGDFYNCEALNMRLHNHSADLNEYGTGTIYFNTGSNTNHSKHAVVHDGTDFKALAFVDEIATNTAFKELEEKVDLLIGDDVDTDTIIDSWKEVQAFLADIEDTKTLQGMLSSYLPKSGGEIKNQNVDILTINRNGGGSVSSIAFKGNDAVLYGYLGFDAVDNPVWMDSAHNRFPLIHSGNIGEHKAGGLQTSTGADAVTIDGYLVKTSSALSVGTFLNINRNANTGTLFDSSKMGFEIEPFASRIVFKGYNTSGLSVGGIFLNSSGNVTIGGSDLARTGAKLYVDGCLTLGGISQLNKPQILFSNNGEYFDLAGNFVFGEKSGSWSIFNGSSANTLFRVKKEGNVLIGTPYELKSGAKLQIKGDVYVDGNIIATKEVAAGGAGQEGESGDGGAEVISQPLAKGQSTYTITNTIKRSDIAVSLYEANVINGQTIWSLCLADIEVTDATITVTFGSATSVNHKLVAVG